MKDFIKDYIVPPTAILLFMFIVPTILMGGFTIAFHLMGYLPEMGFCQKVEK